MSIATPTIPGVDYSVTEDIRPAWLNVVRALQAACHRNRGLATVSVKVLVDENNKPIYYSEPKLEKIHPKMTPLQILLDLTNAE